MEDLRPKTILFCGLLALAIAISVLLRARRPVHFLFAGFACTIALWYGSQSLRDFFRADVWTQATAILTVLMPQLAVWLFERIAREEGEDPGRFPRIAPILGIPVLALALSPYQNTALIRGATYTYVFGLLAVALIRLAQRGKTSRSRALRHRVRFLVVVGALAMTFTVTDFVSFLGVTLPPFSAVLSIVFLAVLAESLTRPRLADTYELFARALVATALAFSMAGIYYLFFVVIGGFRTMYLNGVLAAIVFLVLFEPMQAAVQERIHKFFFRERLDFDRTVSQLRRKLAHVLEVQEMVDNVLSGLEASRRATTVAVYLRDQEGEGMTRAGAMGAPCPMHIDSVALRPLLDRIGHGAISLEELEREVEGAKSPILASAESLGSLRRSAIAAIRGDNDAEILGFICVADERMRDSFSPEEVLLLDGIGLQAGLVVANSRLYARMKERDRLVALGSMAAGLAHEVKNPLGAIKGAAQLLEDDMQGLEEGSREFVGIIVEEVNRLDRVVQSFLDYARPHAGNPVPLDINAAIRRTLHVLAPELDSTSVTISLELAEDLPRVTMDPEKLRQVIINIVQNGVQAMEGNGTLQVATSFRKSSADEGPDQVLISIRDTGPGISAKVLASLFVPFFTTKTKGTGLGLAICQSIVQNAGGSISVQSQVGSGTTFGIRLPVAAGMGAATATTPPVEAALAAV